MTRLKRITPLLALLLLAIAGCAGEGAPYYGPRSGPTGAPPPAAEPGDQYEAVGTNPYTMASHDPFSTFAADVDTASYDIFVRDASQGSLPAAASVRVEEWVNSFDYDYPAPALDAEIPFAIDLVAAEHPFRANVTQLRVGIQTAVPPEFRRVPTNLVFLVDSSGSMGQPNKIGYAKTVMRETIAGLGEGDTVSIVTYSGNTRVALTPTNAGANPGAILNAVEAIETGGGTAGGAGIQLAYEQARAGFIEGGLNHVILMTDGDFNLGISSTDELVELIEEERRSGVTLTALGFGQGNLNDAMMERVSNSGNGVYSVIVSESRAIEYAREDILHTAHFVAQDMKIQVEFNPEHVLAYRLIGYENRAIADDQFRDDAVDAGEVGAGHRVTALYEVVLTDQSIPEAAGAPDVADGPPVPGVRVAAAEEIVRVRVRWKDLGATETDEAHETYAALTPQDVRGAGAGDADLEWASAVAALAELVKASPYADAGHLTRIGEIFAAQASRDDDRAELARLFEDVRSQL